MENFKWEKSSDIELPKHSSRDNPLNEEIVLVPESEDVKTPLQEENIETPPPVEPPIENKGYVFVKEGVANQVNPKLVNISMKDFEGAPIGRNNAERKAVKELSDARERFAFADKEKDPQGYAQANEEYSLKVEKEKDFIIAHKKSTLETKGLFDRKVGAYRKLTPEEVQDELDKYIKVKVVPHFAVVEAAKIQEARIEPSFVEKMKGSELGSFAGKVINGYRKMPWQKKILVSVGLFGAGVAAGAVGGTFGLAVAGVITGGKGIQRLLSGAGTAVGVDALIQKSQQKWMNKEGWGKDRHEYVSKQIALMNEKAKKGVVVDSDIKERLEERRKIEKNNEIRRIGIAAIAGALVGSGTAFRAAKDTFLAVNDYLGGGDYLGNKIGSWPGNEIKATTESSAVATPTPLTAEAVTPSKIEPIKLTIDTRGPEGTLIDEFRNNPDLAKKFGWLGEGKEDLSKWAGSKAHILWEESANQALLDPSVKQELVKLGYPETVEGYEKMMTRIGEGSVSLDVKKGDITLDAEYLKNIEVVDKDIETVDNPYSGDGIYLSYPSQSTDSLFVSDMDRTPTSLEGVDYAEVQRQMESPEGKLRGVLVNSGVRSSSIEDILKREGGVEKLLKMPVRELYGLDQGYPRSVHLDLLYEELKGITGEARLDSNDTLEDVLKSIDSKKIFHGTVEDMLKGEISPIEAEPSYPDVTEGVGNQESPVLVDQEGIADNMHAGVSEKVVDHTPSPDTFANIPHDELTKSPEVKTPEIVEGMGQISPYEVVTKTGIKGVFEYSPDGKIVNMRVEGTGSIMQGKSLLHDNYREVMMNKGAKPLDFRSVEMRAQNLFQQEQVLKSLEDSGKENSEEAKFLKKIIKQTIDQTERKHGDIFKDEIPPAKIEQSHLGVANAVETPISAPEIPPSNEVVTSTGIKGIFEYNSNGKIVNFEIEDSGRIFDERVLFNDNYEEIILKKGGNISAVKASVRQIYLEQQIVKTLEDSGQGESDKAKILRKFIKAAMDTIESKYGKVFK